MFKKASVFSSSLKYSYKTSHIGPSSAVIFTVMPFSSEFRQTLCLIISAHFISLFSFTKNEAAAALTAVCVNITVF